MPLVSETSWFEKSYLSGKLMRLSVIHILELNGLNRLLFCQHLAEVSCIKRNGTFEMVGQRAVMQWEWSCLEAKAPIGI